jgi:putative membrane protein
MMYGWGATGMGGWWMIVGMGIVALAVLGSVWLIVRHSGSAGAPRSTAEEILRERFARGELSGEQFDEAKKRLG